MKNVQFNYLFRDEANYKNFGYVIFANPDQIPLKYIELTIRFHLIDKVFFYAEKWGLPSLKFDGCEDMWHEFESVELTNDEITEKISIARFLVVGWVP